MLKMLFPTSTVVLIIAIFEFANLKIFLNELSKVKTK